MIMCMFKLCVVVLRRDVGCVHGVRNRLAHHDVHELEGLAARSVLGRSRHLHWNAREGHLLR